MFNKGFIEISRVTWFLSFLRDRIFIFFFIFFPGWGRGGGRRGGGRFPGE